MIKKTVQRIKWQQRQNKVEGLKRTVREAVISEYYKLPDWEKDFITMDTEDGKELDCLIELTLTIETLAHDKDRVFYYQFDGEYFRGHGETYKLDEIGQLYQTIVDHIYQDKHHLYHKETIKQLYERGYSYEKDTEKFERHRESKMYEMNHTNVRARVAYEEYGHPSKGIFVAIINIKYNTLIDGWLFHEIETMRLPIRTDEDEKLLSKELDRLKELYEYGIGLNYEQHLEFQQSIAVSLDKFNRNMQEEYKNK